MMVLAELQHLFWRSVRYDPAPPELEDAFEPGPALGARERMAIYRRMYWVRQVDALQESFPRLAAALGEEVFVKTACAYLAAHPSEHPALERLGRHLPEMLRKRGDVERVHAELADIEWRAVLALLAPDPPRVATSSDVREATFAHARLRFAPSLQACRVSAAALALFEGTPAARADARVTVAMARPRFAVEHRALAEDEAGALEAALAGATLAATCEVLAEGGVPRAHGVLRGWLDNGWIVEVVECADD